ncbi:MAG: type II toxin-antitoxin system VapC family toxin [Alphaproteobacteria bacterium]|nr:type II toxin-antitoxin system VapC family toxin [Alphaproteobacteria bacterium]
MTVVVDASVGVRWFINMPGTEAAAALLQQEETLIAPDLVVAESCNVAWKAVRAGLMTPRQADAVAEQLPLALETIFAGIGLARRAGEIARSLDHPVYDCFYLSLAEQANCDMLTMDRRLLRRVARTPWANRVHVLTDLRR